MDIWRRVRILHPKSFRVRYVRLAAPESGTHARSIAAAPRRHRRLRGERKGPVRAAGAPSPHSARSEYLPTPIGANSLARPHVTFRAPLRLVSPRRLCFAQQIGGLWQNSAGEAPNVIAQAGAARETLPGGGTRESRRAAPQGGPPSRAGAASFGVAADLTIGKDRAVRTAPPPPDVNLRRGATDARNGPSRKYGQLPRKTTRL